MKLKKDTNYIAAVERAITEKYGQNTAQDFRNEWADEKEKEYLRQLAELQGKRDRTSQDKEEIVIGDVRITKRRSRQKENRCCPVCKTYSFSRRDDLYMNRFDCCQQCYINFVEFREERWKSGWRPSDGEYKPPRIKSFIQAVKQYVKKFLRRIKNG